jgi:hypothetical protein
MLPRSARWLNDVSSPGAFQGCRLSVSVEDARLVNSLAFFHRWTDAMIMLGNGECRRKAALSNLSGFASRLAQVALPRSFRIGRLRVSAEDARLVNCGGVHPAHRWRPIDRAEICRICGVIENLPGHWLSEACSLITKCRGCLRCSWPTHQTRDLCEEPRCALQNPEAIRQRSFFAARGYRNRPRPQRGAAGHR